MIAGFIRVQLAGPSAQTTERTQAYRGMAKTLVPDHLKAVIAPLLPPARARLKGERQRIPDRPALTGVLFVLRTGWP